MKGSSYCGDIRPCWISLSVDRGRSQRIGLASAHTRVDNALASPKMSSEGIMRYASLSIGGKQLFGVAVLLVADRQRHDGDRRAGHCELAGPSLHWRQDAHRST